MPECIFPKGQKAGINCSGVTVMEIEGREVKVCNNNGCVYNETPLY